MYEMYCDVFYSDSLYLKRKEGKRKKPYWSLFTQMISCRVPGSWLVVSTLSQCNVLCWEVKWKSNGVTASAFIPRATPSTTELGERPWGAQNFTELAGCWKEPLQMVSPLKVIEGRRQVLCLPSCPGAITLTFTFNWEIPPAALSVDLPLLGLRKLPVCKLNLGITGLRTGELCLWSWFPIH